MKHYKWCTHLEFTSNIEYTKQILYINGWYTLKLLVNAKYLSYTHYRLWIQLNFTSKYLMIQYR